MGVTGSSGHMSPQCGCGVLCSGARCSLSCHSRRSPQGVLHRARLSAWGSARQHLLARLLTQPIPLAGGPRSPGGLPWAALGPRSRSAGSGPRARFSALRLRVPAAFVHSPARPDMGGRRGPRVGLRGRQGRRTLREARLPQAGARSCPGRSPAPARPSESPISYLRGRGGRRRRLDSVRYCPKQS